MNLNAKLLAMFGQGGSMFGVSLLEAMKERQDIMVLAADMSTPAGLDKFKTTYPEHFMNMGIAEANMIGTAAGLTDEGYKTISVAQACFISMRCFDQVRQYIGYMGSKQILIGYGSGFFMQFMGNTHYALEDIALMKMVPGMTIVCPSDSMMAAKAMTEALNHDAPMYIRLFGGVGLPIVYKEDFEFEFGKAIKLREGKDIQIIATGSMVNQALIVAEKLEEEGKSVAVVDMHTVKPLDTAAIDMNTGLIVTLEEHRVSGGLGSSVAEYLSQHTTHPKHLRIGVEDRFSKVGDYEFLLDENGFSVEKILEKIHNKLN